MGILTLHELINLNRAEIIRRCGTAAPQAPGHWMNQVAGAILDQLMVELRDGPSRTEAIYDVPPILQVPRTHYHGVGRAVVDLAMELNVPINADDALLLDRCLDAAIAHAVTRHVSTQKIAADGAVNTLHDLTDTAIAAFEVLQTGTVGVLGSTGTLVHRSLLDIRALSQPTT